MKVTRLPIETGVSSWYDTLPPATPARVLDNDINTDWLVIGAGFAGLACASRLGQLQPADDITLIDACRVGQGPAGRNSGFMIDLPHDLSSESYLGNLNHDKNQIMLNRAAIDFASHMANAADMSDQVFSHCGKINAAATEKGFKHLQSYARHLDTLGENYQTLNPQQLSEITGLSFYTSGLVTPNSVMIQPAAFVRGVADHLSKQCNLFENTPAISINKDSSKYRVMTPKGSITATKIILCVNGHIESFGFFKKQLMHVFTYASTTRALTPQEVNLLGGQKQWNIIPADPMGTTVRRISGKLVGGDRIVIRNRFTYDPKMEITKDRLSVVSRNHRQSFNARFPMLKNIEMEYCWGGRLCLSRNNVQAFGEVQPGMYSAACQNGLGLTKGTLSGMMAAELATHCKSNLLQFYSQQDQPTKLLPEPIMSMGASMTLKFKEWQAGAEL